MHPSRSAMSTNSTALGYTSPALPPVQANSCNVSSGFRTIAHSDPTHYEPVNHANQFYSRSSNRNNLHPQHHLYQNFNPPVPQYANPSPPTRSDRLYGSGVQLNNQQRQQPVHPPQPFSWSQSGNTQNSRLPYPNHVSPQISIIRSGEEHSRGVCCAQSAYHQAVSYSVPTQPVTSVVKTGVTNSPTGSVHSGNSNCLEMRMVLPNGPPAAVHLYKRNPPPPPPPRSGSWLVGVTSPADAPRDRTMVHPVDPAHPRHIQPAHPSHGLSTTTTSSSSTTQHTCPSDASNAAEAPQQRQWFSVDYPARTTVGGSGQRIPTGVSSMHNSSDRCSPTSTPCCMNLPHAECVPATFSSSTSSHIQPRFVHRAPPPIPEMHQPTGHSGFPPNQATNPVAASVTPRSVVTDSLLRLLVYHYAAPEPTESSPSSGDNRVALERLLHVLCSNVAGVPAPEHQDAGFVTLARRLLPQLIRIAYTEFVSNEDTPENGVGRTCPARSHDDDKGSANHDQTSSLASTKKSSHPENPAMELSMTASMESRHSCPEDEEDEDVDAETEENTAFLEQREVYDNAVNGLLPVQADLDALPPGTSLAELKRAALEAILRIVPVYQTDASLCERDLGIVRLLATIHAYSTTQTCRIERLRAVHTLSAQTTNQRPVSIERSPRCPVAEVAALVRLSFHPEHRTAICDLGGVHALIALLRCEQTLWSDPALVGLRHSPGPSDTTDSSHHAQSASPSSGSRPGGEHLLETSLALRRYICMALTNLTFGVAANKALLCRRLANLEALLAQMELGNEELKQVSASVLRNLSWRTDARSKVSLRRVNAPRRLTMAAMTAHRDSTLRTTLSALWNLSAHCSHNKRAVCSVDGVFAFLLRTMHCNDLNSRLVIVENSGGILRNISAVIAGRDDYRMLLNKSNCYPILVELLRHSPSLTVVVNVCGTLWNLTAPATCPAEDLVALCRLGVIDLLHMLSRSPHELIRNSSTAVLRNLLHPNQLPASTAAPASRSVHSSSGQQKSTDNNATPSSVPIEDSNAENASSTDTDVGLSSPAAELLYRRRVNARSRLQFGLLSVVLEADDNEEEEEAAMEYESDTEGENEDEDTAELEASIYAHGDYENAHHGSQEELVMDDDTSSGLLHANSLVQSVTTGPKRSHEEQSKDHDCRTVKTGPKGYYDWGHIDQGSEDEQIRVYAEEGTPFPPDSATASCLELNNAGHGPPCPVSFQPNPTANNFAEQSSVADKRGLPVSPSYHSSDMLPHVYALEDSPLHIPSASSPCDSAHSDSDRIPNSRDPESNHDGTEKMPVDDGPCLPSPPPDMSNLVSPLLTLNLDDEYEVNTTSGFNLPPPPPAINESDEVQRSNAESDFVQTPLVFSRGTSSYLSSGPLGTSPSGLQSSPQSECSDPVVDVNSGITDNELEASAGSKCIISPVDSVADDLSSMRFYPKAEGMLDDQADDEVRLPFAEEGTPQDAISFVEDSTVNPYLGASGLGADSGVHYSAFGWHSPVRSCAEPGVIADDDDEPGQAQILQQCIASAMPGNSSFTILSATKSSNAFTADIARTVAFVEEEDNDSVRNFAVEDTPFGTSTKASSLSDLIVSEQKSSAGEPFADSSSSSDSNGHFGPMLDAQESMGHPMSIANHSADRGSSSSSINGETSSDLLSEVIQSAMPKSVSVRVNPTSCDLAPTTTTTTTVAATQGDGDCLQFYAMEGTPGEDEDLSGSSSVHDICDSVMNSFTSHSSSHEIGTATSPVVVSVSTASLEAAAGVTVSVAPTPPRRTTSVLSNQRDPFAPASLTTNRPQAMVAPMPQVARCQTAQTPRIGADHCAPDRDFSDVDKQANPISRDLVGAAILTASGADKDDASSFSSLLSIESVGLEHSLLQECISSAMPRPKVGHGLLLRKPAAAPQLWNQLRSDLGTDESLPEQDDEVQRVQNLKQTAPSTEPSIVPPVKSDEFRHCGSAPSTHLTSVQASSTDSFPRSSPAPVTKASSRSAPRTPGGTEEREKSGGGALHFLGYGSDGALPRPPRSSCNPPVTKSLTSPRNQTALVASASHQIVKPSTVFSVSSETKMSNGTESSKNKPGHIVQPTTRFANSPAVSGAGTSRIPSSTCTGRSAVVSGLPRATRIPANVQVRNSTRVGDTLSASSTSSCLSQMDPVAMTDLLVEGAEAVLAELCAVSDKSKSPTDEAVTGSQSNHSLNGDADGLLLNALPDSTGGLSSNEESLSLDLPALKDSRGRSASNNTSSPAKPNLAVKSSKLVTPSQIRSSATTAASGRGSLPSNLHGRTYGQSRLTTPSAIPAQTLKPSSTSSRNVSRLGGPNGASSLISRTTRAGQPKSTLALSGLPVPSSVSHSRSALTCPPSASSLSLASSRSASTTGSVNNLTSVTQRSHAVSAQSVCAALNKRERVVGITKPSIRPQPGCHARSAIPSNLRYSTATVSSLPASAVPTPKTYRPTMAVSGDASPNPNAPKPIRGGRKSLTGRKPNSSLTSSPLHQQQQQVKPVCKPKSVAAPPSEEQQQEATNQTDVQSSTRVVGKPTGQANRPRKLNSKDPGNGLNCSNSTTTSSNGDVTCTSPNGMWIVRAELGLVNGSQ